jgi:hypothetical protein
MNRTLVLFTLLAAFAFAPARAITNGVPDTGANYPNVGFMAVTYHGYPYLFLWCSGTLIAPDVVLTASHCTIDLDAYIAAGIVDKVYAGFDPQVSFFPGDAQRLFEVDRAVTNPAYTNAGSENGDVALLLLKEKVTDRFPDIHPALLPAAGLLDQLREKNGLNGTTFPAVGYGASQVGFGVRPGGPIYGGYGLRRVATSDYRALGPGYLHLSMNPSTGDGGTCYGDSGGPNFLGDTGIIAMLTVTGDAVCRATNVGYRLDTEAARSFLSPYVALP